MTRARTDAMSIGHLADRLGVTPRALRFWEERGLLPRPLRTPGNARRYDRSFLRAAQGIASLRAAGVGLDEILRLQRTLGAGSTARLGMRGIGQSLEQVTRRLEEHIRHSQALLHELHTARRCVAACTGCDGKAFDHGCITCMADLATPELPDSLSSLLRGATRTELESH